MTDLERARRAANAAIAALVLAVGEAERYPTPAHQAAVAEAYARCRDTLAGCIGACQSYAETAVSKRGAA